MCRLAHIVTDAPTASFSFLMLIAKRQLQMLPAWLLAKERRMCDGVLGISHNILGNKLTARVSGAAPVCPGDNPVPWKD